jgi:hypothetical protein
VWGVLRVGLVVLVAIVLGVAAVSARAAAPVHVRGCATPRGWRVALRDGGAVVVKRYANRKSAGGTRIGWTWRYCRPKPGRFRVLFSDVVMGGGFGNISTHSGLVLAGTWLADVVRHEDGGGRYGCFGSVEVYDLRTGKGRDVSDWECRSAVSGSGASVVSGLVVNPRGFAAWHLTRFRTIGGTALLGISCPLVSLCAAVDTAGDVLTSNNPTGGPAAWSSSSPNYYAPFTAISCPTAQFCAATAGNEVFTSTDPTSGEAAWKVSSIDTRSGWLQAISCPSSSLCVAGDDIGNLVVSTNPSSGRSAWRVMRIDPGTTVTRISCASASLCVATDMTGDVIASTDPSGGAKAWIVTQVDPRPAHWPTDISCPSELLCVATDYSDGDLVISTNPSDGAAAWKLTHVDDNAMLGAVSCASASYCIAFDDIGNVLASTDPAGGASAWGVSTTGPTAATLTAASCPASTLCVATAARVGPTILTSTNPAVGSSWQTLPVDVVPNCTTRSPCPVERIYAVDTRGTRILDSVSPGLGRSLSRLRFIDDRVVWLNHGTPHRARLN